MYVVVPRRCPIYHSQDQAWENSIEELTRLALKAFWAASTLLFDILEFLFLSRCRFSFIFSFRGSSDVILLSDSLLFQICFQNIFKSSSNLPLAFLAFLHFFEASFLTFTFAQPPFSTFDFFAKPPNNYPLFHTSFFIYFSKSLLEKIF